MISHFNLGTNDLAKAEAFYDGLLSVFNATQMFKTERTVFYALGDNSAKLAINLPFDGQPASAGNGSMVAFAAANKEQVDALYAKAMELGGSSEGEPGVREGFGIYAAYFRDLDGNKLGIFCQPQ